MATTLDRPPARRLHRDVKRLDETREQLWTAYTSDNPFVADLRLGLEVMELHHAWFKSVAGRLDADEEPWPSSGELELLYVLAVFGERARSELAEHLCVSLRTAGTRVNALRERGLVQERIVNRGRAEDVHLARLTLEGVELLWDHVLAAAPLIAKVRQRQETRESWARRFDSYHDLRARREIARSLMKVPS
jgi:DNA-binding MarR family transcriptional regulator